MTTQSSSLRIADDLASSPFAWPGAYPRYGIAADGCPICPDCCRAERQLIGTTTGNDGWCLIASSINYEDVDLYCSNCCSRIEAAYEEPSAPCDFEAALTAAERNPSLR